MWRKCRQGAEFCNFISAADPAGSDFPVPVEPIAAKTGDLAAKQNHMCQGQDNAKHDRIDDQNLRHWHLKVQLGQVCDDQWPVPRDERHHTGCDEHEFPVKGHALQHRPPDLALHEWNDGPVDKHPVDCQDAHDHHLGPDFFVAQFDGLIHPVEQQEPKAGDPEQFQPDRNQIGQEFKHLDALVRHDPPQKESEDHQVQQGCGTQTERQPDEMKNAQDRAAHLFWFAGEGGHYFGHLHDGLAFVGPPPQARFHKRIQRAGYVLDLLHLFRV